MTTDIEFKSDQGYIYFQARITPRLKPVIMVLMRESAQYHEDDCEPILEDMFASYDIDIEDIPRLIRYLTNMIELIDK